MGAELCFDPSPHPFVINKQKENGVSPLHHRRWKKATEKAGSLVIRRHSDRKNPKEAAKSRFRRSAGRQPTPEPSQRVRLFWHPNQEESKTFPTPQTGRLEAKQRKGMDTYLSVVHVHAEDVHEEDG